LSAEFYDRKYCLLGCMDITLLPFIHSLFLSLLFTKRRKEPSRQRQSIEDVEDDDEDVDDDD